MIHEGEKLQTLVRNLKKTDGLTREDVAKKMGITKEHLSTVYKEKALTQRIKDAATRALDLPADFFTPPAESEQRQAETTEPEKIDWEARAMRYKKMFEDMALEYADLKKRYDKDNTV